MGQLNGNREEIAATAGRAAEMAHQLAGSLNAQTFDQAFTLRVMRAIAKDGAAISVEGQRAAEQVTMSLDSLFTTYKANASDLNGGEVRTAINGLFQQVENPSAYSAPGFASAMGKVSGALR
jgi:hypothetical protein